MTARELIVDSFAGGGGASTGIHLALGRSPDIAMFLVPRCGERDGQEPRSRSAEEPMATIVQTGNEVGLVAPFLAPRYLEKSGDAPRPRPVEAPPPTTAAGGNAPCHLAAAFLAQDNVGVVS